jgi:prevent-host-death family protein
MWGGRSFVPATTLIFDLQSNDATLRAKFSADLATGAVMKLTRDIQSLSTFKRDTAKIVRQLKKTGQPVVLTVNGKAELVVQDAESYQKLLEAQDRMEAIEGIRRGLESMKRNAGKPAEKFFREFFAEKGISESE